VEFLKGRLYTFFRRTLIFRDGDNPTIRSHYDTLPAVDFDQPTPRFGNRRPKNEIPDRHKQADTQDYDLGDKVFFVHVNGAFLQTRWG
jgi:hypothetical protein